MIPVVSLIYGPLAREMEPLEDLDKNVRSEVLEDYSDFNTNIEDHLRYLPAAAVYALGIAGVKGKNNTVDKTALFLISNTLTNLSVKFLKKQTHRLRPDGSDHLSFPSGHTATAFAGAEFMNQEYKDLSPWFGVAAYTMASATGTLRMLNRKHWLSDVVMGAGVGILTTKLVYLAYPVVKGKIFGNKEPMMMIVPAYEQGLYGFSLAAKFN
ncbi:phosphatase PAP2 family protein [Flavihumibacter sp. R14]|nr:phosphatase PAP2 family protein [Flavihumibacter soli]